MKTPIQSKTLIIGALVAIGGALNAIHPMITDPHTLSVIGEAIGFVMAILRLLTYTGIMPSGQANLPTGLLTRQDGQYVLGSMPLVWGQTRIEGDISPTPPVPPAAGDPPQSPPSGPTPAP